MDIGVSCASCSHELFFKSQVQRPRLGMLDGAAKINLVRGIGYSRFLQSITA